MQGSDTRRRLLAAVAATGLAGCLTDGDGTGDDGSTTGDEPTATDRTPGTGQGTGAAGGTSGELDLREANVVGVEVEGEPGGDVRFSVTLIHDDDGEDGYANWWTVETHDGEELGRRDLAHAHGTQEFTRSETVSVPGDVRCMVVRGHDQTHGYGGRAALVSLPSGRTRFVDQGSERSSFADAECP